MREGNGTVNGAGYKRKISAGSTRFLQDLYSGLANSVVITRSVADLEGTRNLTS